MSIHLPRMLRLGFATAAVVAVVTLGQTQLGCRNPSVALAGKDLFAMHCASCHGSTGAGNGPAAVALKTPPTDLTKLSQRHGGAFPQEQIVETIDGEQLISSHGSREMPVWGWVFRRDRSEAEAERSLLLLLRYLQSIQET
ncbi:MAG: c-type cytochrome [Candidatus Binatia bacterium]